MGLPPCVEYSVAKTTGKRNLKLADAILRRTLAIIGHFKPEVFFVENPHDGGFALRKRPCMKKLVAAGLVHKTSYCRWGRPFRKNTSIVTNAQVDLPTCNHPRGGHAMVAQSGPSKGGKRGVGNTKVYLYPVPEPLLLSLFTQAGMSPRCRRLHTVPFHLFTMWRQYDQL